MITMHLTRTETIEGVANEYSDFANLVSGLDESEWAKASRCDGFDVRDVAGHVIGLAEDVAAGVPGSRKAEEEAASVRGDAPAVAADRLRTVVEQLRAMTAAFDNDDVWNGPSGVPDLTMGEGVLTLWFDTYVHADDIRAAIGRDPVVGTGQRAALAYLEAELGRRRWGPARLEFKGKDEAFGTVEVGDVTATTLTHIVDAHEFVLAATGRLDAAKLGLDADVNIYG
jgi:uncharacterized protein (TIGR03083 family)